MTKPKRKNISLGSLDMPYRPAAVACTHLNVDTPDSMGYEIHEFLNKLKVETGGDVTEFVRRKCGYKSHDEICEALAAEQIDGVAMAIYNIERRRQGVIIGDQTGIGKGRQAAAVIRYAVNQGLKPVFITEKPNLFSDLYRDMAAIGSASLKPFIVNAPEEKTKVKDENGDVVYEPLPNSERNRIIQKAKLPSGFDYVMLTYSQISNSKFRKVGSGYVLEALSDKANFIYQLAADNIIVMDESHNASGDSNTGRVLQMITERTKGVCFLSATFAKRPDNMPVYALKTAMNETALNKEQLIEAIERGGVALQEVISSQLVAHGQMIRRERSYEGIEVNYVYLNDREQEHRAISDNITAIIRDIIKFQEDYVNPELESMNMIKQLENPNAAEVAARKGTEKAGISNTEYFSKVFNVINQMLFAIKAEDVADRAIARLKEGKKPVIAFSSTMGSFLETITNESGQPVSDGDKINADFGTVLMRGLDGVMRYTIKEFNERKQEMETGYDYIDINQLSEEARAFYNNIVNRIKNVSTGIVISPIDLIKQKIQDAGYTVAEVTGRKLEIQLKTLNSHEALPEIAPGKNDKGKKQAKGVQLSDLSPRLRKLMPADQQKAIIGNDELGDVIKRLNSDVQDLPEFYTTDKGYSKFKKENPNAGWKEYEQQLKPVLHYFLGGTDIYVLEYDEKENLLYGFTVLNGDWQNAEYGYTSLDELMSVGAPVNVYASGRQDFSFRKGFELDFFWDRNKTMSWIKSRADLNGLGKTAPAQVRIIGTVKNRKKENVFDAFRRFNDNEVDVLMINQAGSTGASAHATPTRKVKASQVRQRVMIVLQAELDINKEVQKRGRVNRTGQIMKPIYDYLISKIPAEGRLMMMLQKKLKSLDANTSSNQKNSENLLSVDDFLNKYGDTIVKNYLLENVDLNEKLGDLLNLKESSSDNQKQSVPENLAHRASGRVAVLNTETQEKFYTDIMDLYASYVNLLKQQDEYDLEVETMNLQADIREQKFLTIGRGGSSPFGDNTILNKCEVNVLKKPFTVDELNNILVAALDGKEWRDQAREIHDRFLEHETIRRENELREIKEDNEKRVNGIKDEMGYRKLDDEESRFKYIKKRQDDLAKALDEKLRKAEERSDNRKSNLKGYFSFFFTGRKLWFPNDVESESTAKTLAVFTGYKFNQKADNPFAPSAIKACFAIASGKKYIELPLSYTKELLAIRGASADAYISENWWSGEGLKNEWVDYIRRFASSDRGIRYIITGNLLQAFGKTDNRYKGKLISFTTFDNKVMKGILLPDTFNPDRDNDNNFKESLTSVPIYKARKPIVSMSVNSVIISDNSALTIGRRGYEKFEFILSKSKSVAGNIYLDQDVLQYIEGNNFNTSGNTMIGRVTNDNLFPLLQVMQNKHGVTVQLRDWQVDLIQDEIELNIGSDIVPGVPDITPDNDPVDLMAIEFEMAAAALELLEI